MFVESKRPSLPATAEHTKIIATTLHLIPSVTAHSSMSGGLFYNGGNTPCCLVTQSVSRFLGFSRSCNIDTEHGVSTQGCSAVGQMDPRVFFTCARIDVCHFPRFEYGLQRGRQRLPGIAKEVGVSGCIEVSVAVVAIMPARTPTARRWREMPDVRVVTRHEVAAGAARPEEMIGRTEHWRDEVRREPVALDWTRVHLGSPAGLFDRADLAAGTCSGPRAVDRARRLSAQSGRRVG